MKILGIDPGYERCGVAVLEYTSRDDVKVVFSSCITTDKEITHAERLGLIAGELEKVIKEHKPDECAVETLFFAKNKKTALGVAEARGVVLSVASQKGLTIHEYNPSAVKIAITGHGNSTKGDIMTMLPKLIDLPHTPEHDDEYDAIAIALTHCVTQNL